MLDFFPSTAELDTRGSRVGLSHTTLPETNSSPMKTPLFPCKYHQKGGFSMAMLVLGRVMPKFDLTDDFVLLQT